MSTEGPRSPLRLVGRPELLRTASAYLDAGLRMAYQPIVHLGSGSVLAYEALARPQHPDAANPMEFFAALEAAGMRLDGERAAFTAAMERVAGLPRVKLFVNASPTTLVDPQFDVGELLALAEAHGLAPSDLVVEVTESEAVDDLDALAQRADRLRQLGVGVAVDDAGAGHASFRVITRLRPQYIKLDRDLVSHVDSDGARHAFIAAMVRFAREIGSRLIAEGIETEAELACLAGLNVEAGQGWFLARPSLDEWVTPSADARRVIALAAQRPHLGGAQVTAGDLSTAAVTIDRDATLAQAHARFLADFGLGLLVAVDGNRVLGQISRGAVDRIAAGGSWQRLADRPAVDFADLQALTVPADLDVVEVASAMAARPRDALVEEVVVTDPLGRLVGVVGVQAVLRSLADVRRRTTRDLNPLSGLSGPAWLEADLERRLLAEDSITALWVDLDGFRRINDAGGFALGDDMLRGFGQTLRGVGARVPGGTVFHVGADDFVLLVPPAAYEDTLSEIVRGFEQELLPFIRTELRMRGAGDLIGDLGLSMAAIDLVGAPPPGHRFTEWVQDGLAALIPLAKSQPGHAMVRRSGDFLQVTTWTPQCAKERTVDLGATDPGTVLAAVELAERTWVQWLGEGSGDGADDEVLGRFPGPREVIERLYDIYLRDLRDGAEQALREGAPMILRVQGREDEIMELLDRLALVARRAHLSHRMPVPPELALLDRLVRSRTRVLERAERLERIAQTPPRRRTSSIAP